jgi:glutaredoxin-related protein
MNNVQLFMKMKDKEQNWKKVRSKEEKGVAHG